MMVCHRLQCNNTNFYNPSCTQLINAELLKANKLRKSISCYRKRNKFYISYPHFSHKGLIVFLSWPWKSETSTKSFLKYNAKEPKISLIQSLEAKSINGAIRESGSEIKTEMPSSGTQKLIEVETAESRNDVQLDLPHSQLVVTKPRMHYNASTLAYLGDGVYEMYARRHFLSRQNVDAYYKKVISVVCCEAQDLLLKRLLKSNFLTTEEREVVRWGRNVNTGSSKAKGRAGSDVYKGATSLEALVGYLYLTNSSRLDEMMIMLGFDGTNCSVIGD